jgi:transcriptional regulator with XRE-family HTH domain
MTSAEFRQLRDRLGLSQAELGRLMGLHAREISRIEIDRQPTRLHAAFIRYIAAARSWSLGRE